jgi:hypothetical protein
MCLPTIHSRIPLNFVPSGQYLIPRAARQEGSNMTRWFVGVKHDGRREVFAEFSGTDPTASVKGYAEVCGPYSCERDAANAAKAKPPVAGGGLRNRRKS